jgi:carbon storage regulator CsrA
MPVSSLQCHETIMVGSDIEITVVHIGGNTVQLEINAPREFGVHRKETSEANLRKTTGETKTIWLCTK